MTCVRGTVLYSLPQSMSPEQIRSWCIRNIGLRHRREPRHDGPFTMALEVIRFLCRVGKEFRAIRICAARTTPSGFAKFGFGARRGRKCSDPSSLAPGKCTWSMALKEMHLIFLSPKFQKPYSTDGIFANCQSSGYDRHTVRFSVIVERQVRLRG